jgi:hypothetical protein
MFDADTGFPLGVLNLPPLKDLQFCMSPDLTMVATWQTTSEYQPKAAASPLKLYDTAAGKLLREWPLVPTDACFSPDSKRLTTMGSDGQSQAYDVDTGALRASNRIERLGANYSIFFTSDGMPRAAGSEDGVTHIVDLNSGAEVVRLTEPDQDAYLGEFSPDGQRAFMPSRKTCYLMDASRGLDVARFKFTELTHGRFSPDGTRVMLIGGWAEMQILDSVPYRQRRAELQRRADHAATAKRVAAEALAAGGMRIQSAAAVLRRDPSLSAEIRQLAFDELFRECAARTERAADLLKQFPLVADAIAAIESDASLMPGVRADLSELARFRGDDPERLNSAAWQLMLSSAATSEQCHRALRAAEAAVAAEPTAAYLNTLALAQYRSGKYQEALATDEKSVTKGGSAKPSDLAITAMCQSKLGRTDDARATLQKLRDSMRNPENAKDQEDQALLKEAEALVASASTTTSSTGD